MDELWKHNTCGNVEIKAGGGQPTLCSWLTIPSCPDPELGFEEIAEGYWKCESCGFTFACDHKPNFCHSATAQPCPDVHEDDWTKICDL